MLICINGFGRIGRADSRIAFEDHGVEVARINDITDARTLPCLLKRDSTCGLCPHNVEADQETLWVEGREFR